MRATSTPWHGAISFRVYVLSSQVDKLQNKLYMIPTNPMYARDSHQVPSYGGEDWESRPLPDLVP